VKYEKRSMRALRCTRCGDTRWSICGFRARAGVLVIHRCELCGGEMVEERRQPNHGPARLVRERRSVHAIRAPAKR
jgi:transcription elongation factor Elf1